jgi:hypothetical protein
MTFQIVKILNKASREQGLPEVGWTAAWRGNVFTKLFTNSVDSI